MRMPDLAWPAGVVTVEESDPRAAGQWLADRVAEQLRAALASAARASLAVSGGSTPTPFFEALRTRELPWQRVDITLADERWVSETEADSNAGLIRASLMQDCAAAANFVPLWYEAPSIIAGQALSEAALSTMQWPLDVLVLGMGNDGHTASLFPDAPELPMALAPDTVDRTMVLRPPSQARERLSLTYRTLRAARFTALHLKGADKLLTLEKALSDLADVQAMPIRGFLRSGLEVVWSPG